MEDEEKEELDCTLEDETELAELLDNDELLVVVVVDVPGRVARYTPTPAIRMITITTTTTTDRASAALLLRNIDSTF